MDEIKEGGPVKKFPGFSVLFFLGFLQEFPDITGDESGNEEVSKGQNALQVVIVHEILLRFLIYKDLVQAK